MAKERVHELPVTRGNYCCKGIVNGVEKQDFYTEKKTKTKKDFRMVKFAVEYDDKKSIFMSLNGMPRDKVYFTKKDANGKNIPIPVDWKNRFNPAPDNARMIGVNCGLTKTTNKEGKIVNDKKVLTDFDACEYISKNMKDDSSVFVRGNIDFSSYFDKEGNLRRSVKYVPTQISLCKDVDFDEFHDLSEKEQRQSHCFDQRIIFMGIEPEEVNGKNTNRFILSAKIITYDDIIDAEFIVDNKARASWFKKNMKEYWAVDIGGVIEVTHNIEMQDNDDDPFEENPTKPSITKGSKVEMIIVSRELDSIDKETYTEKNVTNAIRKIRNAKNAESKFVMGPEDASDDDAFEDSPMDSDEDSPWD